MLKIQKWFCCVSLNTFAILLGSIYIILSPIVAYIPIQYFIQKKYVISGRISQDFAEMLVLLIYCTILGIIGISLLLGSIKKNTRVLLWSSILHFISAILLTFFTFHLIIILMQFWALAVSDSGRKQYSMLFLILLVLLLPVVKFYNWIAHYSLYKRVEEEVERQKIEPFFAEYQVA